MNDGFKNSNRRRMCDELLYLSQLFSQLHSPLIVGVDVPDNSLQNLNQLSHLQAARCTKNESLLLIDIKNGVKINLIL